MRIALIHATPLAMEPIESAFAKNWPTVETASLLDASLSADLARDGDLNAAMVERFHRLADYGVDTGADGILFTCSAFGPAIEAVSARLSPMPVLKPNEAMFEDAISSSKRIGMVATFGPSIPSMVAEFDELSKGSDAELVTQLSEGAMDALSAGDAAEHDRMIVETAMTLGDCDILLMAQFSMARAADAVVAATGKQVLTSPTSAIDKLKRTFKVAA